MSLFFTSDLHLGHVNAATKFRNYASVEAHDQDLVDRWNAVVTDDDIVIVVGDLCMGKVADSLVTASMLNGWKYLVPGNHDRMHESGRHKGDAAAVAASIRGWEDRYLAEAGFVTLPHMFDLSRNWASVPEALVGVTVCHFPFADDHEEYADQPRYPAFRPKDNGKRRLIHGHIHEMRREHADGRQVNVGVDVWDFAPVSAERLVEVMGW